MEKDMTEQEKQELFKQIQDKNGFQIEVCNKNLSNPNRFESLKLTSEQKMHISELLQHIPTAAAAGTMATAYTVSFPKGLPHTLMSLKQGGFGSQIMNNGKIAGSASFYPMFGQAAVLGIFTAMSIATGQYFLAQINREIKNINQKLDEILKFLHINKKAALLSEEEFIKYAYDNYAYIMKYEPHQIATITSIQNAKKVAIQDIEFYLNELDDKVASGSGKRFTDLKELIKKEIKQTQENLNRSQNLYLMSSVLEVYYSQNFDEEYINNIKNRIKNYITHSKDRSIENAGILIGYLKKDEKILIVRNLYQN